MLLISEYFSTGIVDLTTIIATNDGVTSTDKIIDGLGNFTGSIGGATNRSYVHQGDGGQTQFLNLVFGKL